MGSDLPHFNGEVSEWRHKGKEHVLLQLVVEFCSISGQRQDRKWTTFLPPTYHSPMSLEEWDAAADEHMPLHHLSQTTPLTLPPHHLHRTLCVQSHHKMVAGSPLEDGRQNRMVVASLGEGGGGGGREEGGGREGDGMKREGNSRRREGVKPVTIRLVTDLFNGSAATQVHGNGEE